MGRRGPGARGRLKDRLGGGGGEVHGLRSWPLRPVEVVYSGEEGHAKGSRTFGAPPRAQHPGPPTRREDRATDLRGQPADRAVLGTTTAPSQPEPRPFDNPTDLARSVTSRLHAIIALIRESQSRAWLEADLTMSQMKTLLIIGEARGIAMGAVAERLGVGLPTVSQVVDRMVRAGFVDRCQDPRDRRVARCTLTAEGQQLYDRVVTIALRRVEAWIAQLDDEALVALDTGLEALIAASTPARTSMPPAPELRSPPQP